MNSNPLKGLFGVSSPRAEVVRAGPQPTENVYYEIPFGIMEKLHANPYAGDGTIHPDMHLLFIDELCGLFRLAGLSRNEVKKKLFPLSLEEKHWHGIGYWMILIHWIGTD